jgi:hypothetical protein
MASRAREHESFGRPGYGLHFRLTKAADVDRGLKALMREVYALYAGRSERG